MVMAYIAIEYPVDDAFIVFRYVDRFLDGQGLTFNNHEYVEGYTSLSWTLLLTLLSYTGLNPHAASLLANYIFILLVGLTMYWLLVIFRINRTFRLIALFFFGTSLLFFKVVYLGLELGMFIWLLLLFLCVVLVSVGFPRFDGISKPFLILSGALGALLFATRPEALFLAPLLILACIVFGRGHKALVSHVHYFLIPFSILFLLVVLWRLLYYGEILPNSIIAKSISLSTLETPSLSWLKEILLGSAKYYFDAYKENPLFILVPILSIYLVVKRKQAFILILLLIPVAWQHFVIFANGGDWMSYFRFINLYTPLIIICLVVVLAQIVQTSRFFASLLLVVAACLHLYTNLEYLDIRENHLHQALGKAMNDKWYEGDLYRAIGESLNDGWIENDILIPEAIGNIGYFAPAIYIDDPTGLTDGKLSKDAQAQRTVYGRTDWHYSMGLNPAVIVLHWWPQPLSHEDLEGFDFYCAGPLPNSVDGASLYVLIRRDRVASYRKAILHLGLESIPSTARESLKGAATDWCRASLSN
jgi:arabinofuranosyltransferase